MGSSSAAAGQKSAAVQVQNSIHLKDGRVFDHTDNDDDVDDDDDGDDDAVWFKRG